MERKAKLGDTPAGLDAILQFVDAAMALPEANDPAAAQRAVRDGIRMRRRMMRREAKLLRLTLANYASELRRRTAASVTHERLETRAAKLQAATAHFHASRPRRRRDSHPRRRRPLACKAPRRGPPRLADVHRLRRTAGLR
jgi:hypothetical protein